MDMNESAGYSPDHPGDAALIGAIQGGLPLVERPFAAIAADLGLEEEAVIARIQTLMATGAIKRLGVVVRHKELGYGANAMVVWDLPDAEVDALGRRIGQLPYVTLCYRRPRCLPDWPFNLFTMIHGRDRTAVLALIAALKRDLDLEASPCEVLFSGRRFKQRGAFYQAAATRGTRPATDSPAAIPAATGTTGGEVGAEPPRAPRRRGRSQPLPFLGPAWGLALGPTLSPPPGSLRFQSGEALA